MFIFKDLKYVPPPKIVSYPQKMLMDLGILFSFLFASVLLTLTPGPDILYVLTVSMQRGKKAALQLTWGLTSGLFFHTALVALGWSQLLVAVPELKQGIQWLGAIYICYLAVQAFRQNRLSQTGVTHPAKNYFRQGLLMSLTNPKVTLFFMIFFPSFLFSKLLSTPMQLTLLGFLFWAQAQLIFTFVASLGHVYQQSQFFKVTQKYHHIIESGILLTIAIIVVFGA